MKKLNILVIILILGLLSCSDDDSKNLQANLQLKFDNHVGGEELALSTGTYNKNGNETLKVDELKYIISNVKLQRENGNVFTYPVGDSYFVINEENKQSLNVDLSEIPAGNYTKISFGFGIDQSNYPLNGVDNFIPTAEDNGMLWAWAAGYKFLKFEGTYTDVSGGEFQNFIYHIGSHGDNLDNYKLVELDLGQSLRLDQNEQSILVQMDVLKIFNAVHELNLLDKDDIQVDPVNAPKIAENVRQSFTIKSVD